MRNLRNYFCAWLALVVLFSGLAAAALAAGPYHGNMRSRIYHNSNCRYYACKNCTAVFETAGAARAAGFRACKVCGG